jgi:hypothetical protein
MIGVGVGWEYFDSRSVSLYYIFAVTRGIKSLRIKLTDLMHQHTS